MVDYISNLDVSPSLQHYGILGMKWGVRRYQNADGSYTSLGKRRRRSDGHSEDYKTAHAKRDTRTMSNKELKSVNERLQLEKNNKQLKQKAGTKLAATIITGAVTSIATATLIKHGNDMVAAGSSWLASNGGVLAKTALSAAVNGTRHYVSI